MNKESLKAIDNIKSYLCPEYFIERGWSTPNQLRDSIIESIYSQLTDFIQESRILAQEENKRREKDDKYIKCNRCYGYHKQKDNIDGLCEKCEQTTAPYRFDMKNH